MNIFRLDKIDKVMSMIEKFVLGTCMIVMAAALLTTLVLRELGISIAGGEEVAKFTMIWITFWGLALCARRGINISMSALLDKMPANAKKIMTMTICLITGVSCLYLAVLGIQLTSSVFTSEELTPTLGIPLWYFFIAAPIGFALSGVYYLVNVVNSLRTKKILLNMTD